MRRGAAVTNAMLAAVVGFCGLTLLLGYLNKARCAGAPYDADGRSLVFDRIKDTHACYSDIQYLWLGRGINEHVFPYIDGGINHAGQLTGGTVEYPVLSGALMWLGAIGAHNDAMFLLNSALLLTPFALVTAWMLGRLAGRAAFLWAAGPPLVLYAFHNWELPVVLTAVGAVYVVTMCDRLPLRVRGIAAGVLLAVGFCLKLYPGAFVLPLMAFVLTGGVGGREMAAAVPGRFDIRGSLAVAGAAVTTAVAINLPFAVAGYPGWKASFTFQAQRRVDNTTNSIWFWGLRKLFGDDSSSESSFQQAVSIASPVLVFMSFALALWLGWKRYNSTGTYPWVQVSGAMLCGFLLFHKVHSPQYTLWLVPFLVLLAVPWKSVAAYLVADVAVGIGIFLHFGVLEAGGGDGWQENLLQFGVWSSAVLLVWFFFAFLRAGIRNTGDAPVPAGDSTPPELVSVAT